MVAARAVKRVDVLVSTRVALKVGVTAALLVGLWVWRLADESAAMSVSMTAERSAE